MTHLHEIEAKDNEFVELWLEKHRGLERFDLLQVLVELILNPNAQYYQMNDKERDTWLLCAIVYLASEMNRYSYDVFQSYICINGNKDQPLTMLYLYDFGIRPFSYRYKAEYDVSNALLTKMDYAPIKYPQFDSKGYLTPLGLEDEREQFAKEMQNEELSQYLNHKGVESEWWLNSAKEEQK